MKITTFNPLIVTKDAESAIAEFEALGFERHHTEEGIGIDNVTVVRMKDTKGFYVDISQGDGELTMIRMNVDNLEEATELLKAHGFRMIRHEAAKETVDTGSSKYNIMVSPSGFVLDIAQHIKDQD